MFKIVDNTTGLYLKGVPYGTLGDRDLSKVGRVFKRKSDVSNHISQNLEFYRKYVNRFEIIECELVEVNRSSISDALKAKDEREKVKKEELRKWKIKANLEEIERLKLKLNVLTGKS